MIPDVHDDVPEQPTRPRPRRVGSVVVGAVDGLIAVALPFAVLAVVAVLAWAGLGARGSWIPAIGAAADAWLIGHGVDVRFLAAGAPFTVTITALGPALVTALCAVRAGRRAARTGSPVVAWVAGAVAAGAASALVLRLGSSEGAQPVGWQAIVLPALLVALASLAGLRSARPGARPLPAGVRSGLMAVVLVIGAGAVALALALLTRFADVIALDESLGAGPVGGLVLTGAQLLAIPTLVVWSASWLLGAGFALGAGSVSGPFGAQVGPLPALPVLGAVPAEPPTWAAVVVLVPVLAGFVAAVLVRRSGGRTGAVRLGAVTGAVAAVCLGGLALLASGAAGPGRFADVGPDPLLVAGLAAVLVGLPAMLGAAVIRPERPAEEGGPAPH